jgi:tryptophan halogenase
VYASEFAGDDAIAMELADWAGTARTATAPSGLLRGRPREFWVRNCVLMPGDALDPLETTALHLAQSGITRLLAHFPVRADSPTDRGEYNRLTAEEYDRIRDLLVLHYHASARDDSPLWQRCRAMQPPDTLAQRLALFADSARLTIGEDEHCGTDGWLAVLLGQGVRPRSYDPLAEVTPAPGARDAFARMAAEMRARAAGVPLHREYLLRSGLMAPVGAPSIA